MLCSKPTTADCNVLYERDATFALTEEKRSEAIDKSAETGLGNGDRIKEI